MFHGKFVLFRGVSERKISARNDENNNGDTLSDDETEMLPLSVAYMQVIID